MRIFMRHRGIRMVLLFCGAVLYAFSVARLLEPNRVAPGGVSGLAIIFNHFTGITAGFWIIVLNIPLILLGIKSFGLRFFEKTIFVICTSAAFVSLFETFPVPLKDPLLAAACGGCVDAVSIGLILKLGGTTGGTDIAAKLLNKKYPRMEMGKLFIVIDLMVVAFSAVAFQNIEAAIYSGLCVVVTGNLLDRILYGGELAKMLVIISNRSEEIGRHLLGEIDTGVTYLKGNGGYTFQEKNVIICIIRKRLLPGTLHMIHETDAEAFVIVTSADQVVGKGYQVENS